MATVILFNAARMQEIEDGTVTSGLVDVDGHLILYKHDGSTVDAGLVKGEDGADGTDGVDGTDGTDGIDGTNGLDGIISPGMIFNWPIGKAVPSYIGDCNGAAISRSLYSDLFGLIGTMYGAGDGSTTFNLPNLPAEPVAIVEKNFTTGNQVLTTGYVDLVNGTVTGTSDGSVVRIDITQILQNAGSGGNRTSQIRVLCDGAVVKEWTALAQPLGAGGDQRYSFASMIEHTPAAGSHTWKVQALCTQAASVAAQEGSLVISQFRSGSVKKVITLVKQGIPNTVVSGGSGLGLGMIVGYPGVTGAPIPANCLELNGQTVSAATYSALAALFPTWVSGSDLVLPDLRGKSFAGYKSGDAIFGTLGGSVGAQTHTHPLSDNGQAQVGMSANASPSAQMRRIATAAYTATHNVTAAGGTSSVVSSSGAALAGATDAGSSIQPTYIGRWLIVAADGAGEYSPTVQAALTGRMAKKENIAAFQVRLLANKTMSGAASLSKIVWDGVDLNRFACFDVALSRFIAPVAGLYEFSVAITQGTTTTGPIVYLYKNGVQWPGRSSALDPIVIAYKDYNTAHGSSFLELAAGDYVEVFMTNANNVTTTIGAYGTMFKGKLLEAY